LRVRKATSVATEAAVLHIFGEVEIFISGAITVVVHPVTALL